MTVAMTDRPSTASAAQRLRQDAAAVRVSFTWFGVRKALTTEQRNQAAESFGAESDFLSARKKLLDTKHPAYKEVTAIKGKMMAYHKSVSLPFPEPGMRLLRRDRLDAFQHQMEDFKEELQDAVSRPSGRHAEVSPCRVRGTPRRFAFLDVGTCFGRGDGDAIYVIIGHLESCHRSRRNPTFWICLPIDRVSLFVPNIGGIISSSRQRGLRNRSGTFGQRLIARRIMRMSKLHAQKAGDHRIKHGQALAAPTKGRRRIWFFAAVLGLLSAYGTYYLVEFVFWPRVPAHLVGAWRVVGGPQDGVVLEFLPNGLFQATISNGKEGAAVRARARVEGKLIHIASTNPGTGAAETKTHIIHRLTETELALEDPVGVVSRLVRVE
jgi:hypothetical protein